MFATGINSLASQIFPRLAEQRPIGPIAGHHHADGMQQDETIEPQRGIVQIPNIERSLIKGANVAPAVDLRPPGHTRPGRQTRGKGGRLIARQQRARTDKRHTADKDIVKLREFVEAQATQRPADARDTVCVGDQGATVVMGAAHGAKFEQAERPTVQARTLLPEDDREADIAATSTATTRKTGISTASNRPAPSTSRSRLARW